MRRRAGVATLGDSKVLYLTGSPYEQGKQLGQGAADEIRENMWRAAEFRDQVAAGRDQADYHALTRTNERWVSTVYPELLDELIGIAEGANVDYGELLSMNLNTHISHIYSATLACTQVLATGPPPPMARLTSARRAISRKDRCWPSCSTGSTPTVRSSTRFTRRAG
jgi:hypothetical protein